MHISDHWNVLKAQDEGSRLEFMFHNFFDIEAAMVEKDSSDERTTQLLFLNDFRSVNKSSTVSGWRRPRFLPRIRRRKLKSRSHSTEVGGIDESTLWHIFNNLPWLPPALYRANSRATTPLESTFLR